MNRVTRRNRDYLKKYGARITALATKEVAVGFPRHKGLSQAYYDTGASVLDVAVYNNFGTHRIPARPFMDIASLKIQKDFKSRVGSDVSACLKGKFGSDVMMNRWGVVAKGMIQLEIGRTPPPNAPSTIKAKGSATPLIDTGHLRKSVTYVLRKKSA